MRENESLIQLGHRCNSYRTHASFRGKEETDSCGQAGSDCG